MPLPTPSKDEKQSHFISRCISFERKASPGRPTDQVQAMCYTAWRRHKGIKQSKPAAATKHDEKREMNVSIDNVTLVDLKQSTIDKDNNIIRGVAILTTTALDKSDRIFRKFTDDAMNDAVSVFNGALARLDHDRETTDIPDGEGRGVRTGFGVYQNVRRNNGTVIGDLHLWDCPEAKKVMSIAERTPGAVGNSIHAAAIATEGEDGVEVVQRLLPRTVQGLKVSVDLVEDPAATISLYQDRRKKLKDTTNSKENGMEFETITIGQLKTNRSDIYDTIKAEGFASRDDEVKTLTQERDEAKKGADEAKKSADVLQVKQTRAEHEVLVDRILGESDLPDYAKTDVFHKQLMDVKESKDGDKTVSVEDGIKALIQDRADTLEPEGVRDNPSKDVALSKKNKVTVDEVADAFGSDDEYYQL